MLQQHNSDSQAGQLNPTNFNLTLSIKQTNKPLDREQMHLL